MSCRYGWHNCCRFSIPGKPGVLGIHHLNLSFHFSSLEVPGLQSSSAITTAMMSSLNYTSLDHTLFIHWPSARALSSSYVWNHHHLLLKHTRFVFVALGLNKMRLFQSQFQCCVRSVFKLVSSFSGSSGSLWRKAPADAALHFQVFFLYLHHLFSVVLH